MTERTVYVPKMPDVECNFQNVRACLTKTFAIFVPRAVQSLVERGAWTMGSAS